MFGELSRIRRIHADLFHQLGRSPTLEETAQAAGTTLAEVGKVMRMIQPLTSIHRPIGRDEDTEFGDLLSVQDERHPVEQVGRGMLHTRLQELLEQKLSWREREIIKLRYGLGDGYNYTLEEIAYVFQVTRERIRQLEARAVGKLQDPACSSELVGFLD